MVLNILAPNHADSFLLAWEKTLTLASGIFDWFSYFSIVLEYFYVKEFPPTTTIFSYNFSYIYTFNVDTDYLIT
jgi:hypothetical protein